jgi:2-dehydro-3-deoxyphosphogluconate aldolase / (4S)-4-hydroxy-2-oxoglutarate aldolase
LRLLDRLAAAPIVAILRAATADRFLDAGLALCKAGVRAVEVTLTSAGALDAFARLRAELPADTLVGVGSVKSTADVDAAAAAGAGYLVTPLFRPDLVARAVEQDVPMIAGALTPSEIAAAWAAGAAAVKVFPVSAVGGPSYIKAVRAPLPEVPLVPTGGVEINDIFAYLAAGAVAVGIGSPLLGDACEVDGDLQALRERARRAVTAAAT